MYNHARKGMADTSTHPPMTAAELEALRALLNSGLQDMAYYGRASAAGDLTIQVYTHEYEYYDTENALRDLFLKHEVADNSSGRPASTFLPVFQRVALECINARFPDMSFDEDVFPPMAPYVTNGRMVENILLFFSSRNHGNSEGITDRSNAYEDSCCFVFWYDRSHTSTNPGKSGRIGFRFFHPDYTSPANLFVNDHYSWKLSDLEPSDPSYMELIVSSRRTRYEYTRDGRRLRPHRLVINYDHWDGPQRLRLTGCNSNWKFCDYLQHAGERLTPQQEDSFTRGDDIFPFMLAGANIDGESVTFNYENRNLVLGEQFVSGQELFIGEPLSKQALYGNARSDSLEREELPSCSICLDLVESHPEDHNYCCLPCGHEFHAVCMHRVIISGSRKCPICRIPLDTGHILVVQREFDAFMRYRRHHPVPDGGAAACLSALASLNIIGTVARLRTESVLQDRARQAAG